MEYLFDWIDPVEGLLKSLHIISPMPLHGSTTASLFTHPEQEKQVYFNPGM